MAVHSAVELTLGREADAVPKARRFVSSSLSGEPAAAVHNVALVVTELVTNSLLHGEPPVSVRLVHLGPAIRVEVEDAGHGMPLRGLQDSDSMTGRGLALVAALSSAWGVSPGRGPGKVVWAELPVRETALPPGRTPQIDPRVYATSTADHDGEPVCTVRLPGIPTGLLLAAKSHMDSVVRELLLVRGGRNTSPAGLAPAMETLVATVTGEFAEARDQIKRQAVAAAERGDLVTDLRLQLPLSCAQAGERYLAALDDADRYARSARLLTLASPRSHTVFRRWYVGSVVAQLKSIAAGGAPELPPPLAAVLAGELDRIDGVNPGRPSPPAW